MKRNPQAYQNPRGIIVAISPWNFPLAIFTGEVVSALVAGNVVLAKPAEQTSLMAHYAVELCYQAGIPKGVLQCLPGSGAEIGNQLTSDSRVDGVILPARPKLPNHQPQFAKTNQNRTADCGNRRTKRLDYG
ncbi:bifunctional proline dehydrogenase/pyrroline-5-carboxylate dehydrogenase [Actinobacillus equuli]|nr:bifunctional proline dehydrogenase/pyrroline-5-carboxylate dehydrogenase [Actinobacillus equuli]